MPSQRVVRVWQFSDSLPRFQSSGRSRRHARVRVALRRRPGEDDFAATRAGRDAKDMRQPVDRDHQDVIFNTLNATRTDDAKHADRATACPSSPAPRQPRRLLAHPSEMTSVERSGLSLDGFLPRGGNAGGRDRHRVDVPLTLPRQRVPKPPPLRLERGERALHLVFRAGADTTATSERKPAPSIETQPDGRENQQPAERRRSRDRNREPEQPDDDAFQRRLSGVREPAVLAGDARSSRGDRLELVDTTERALAVGRLNHCSIVAPAPDGPRSVGFGLNYDLLRPFSSGIGPRMDREEREKPRISRAFGSTATGIRTRVSAVRGRSAVRRHPAMSCICTGNSLGRQSTLPPNAPLMWAVSGLSGGDPDGVSALVTTTWYQELVGRLWPASW